MWSPLRLPHHPQRAIINTEKGITSETVASDYSKNNRTLWSGRLFFLFDLVLQGLFF